MPLPKTRELYNLILQILLTHGGSLPVKELESLIADSLHLTNAERLEMHSATKTKLSYKVAWARYYLKKQGLLSSQKRGVSILSEKGKHITKI